MPSSLRRQWWEVRGGGGGGHLEAKWGRRGCRVKEPAKDVGENEVENCTWVACNQFIETAEFLIRVSPSHSYIAGRAGLGWMSGWVCRNVYAACSGYVVGLVLAVWTVVETFLNTR
jgi:hypothetical protein